MEKISTFKVSLFILFGYSFIISTSTFYDSKLFQWSGTEIPKFQSELTDDEWRLWQVVTRFGGGAI